MKLVKISSHQAWQTASNFATKNDFCKSVGSKPITYQLRFVDDQIVFNCTTRSEGKDEKVSKDMFIEFIESIEKIEPVNTNTIKSNIPNSIYRMRSPMIALLMACELLQ
jgi:hypothetical protein